MDKKTKITAAISNKALAALTQERARRIEAGGSPSSTSLAALLEEAILKLYGSKNQGGPARTAPCGHIGLLHGRAAEPFRVRAEDA